MNWQEKRIQRKWERFFSKDFSDFGKVSPEQKQWLKKLFQNRKPLERRQQLTK